MCKLCSGTGKYRGITGQLNYCGCRLGTQAEIDATEEVMLKRDEFTKLSRPEQIALRLRFNAERWALRNGYKRSLQYLCGVCSAALALALRREGFRPTVVEGEVANWSHAWVVHGRKIIDVTFTQFDGRAPRVLITAKDDGRFRPMQSFNGKRLDAWLIDPRLLGMKKDIKILTSFQPADADSRVD
jgi:hypothetical protein